MTVLLGVWHPHCTKARFTVRVSCSDYVRSFACKGRIRNLGADCSTIGLSFRNNNMATNLQRFISVTQCCHFSWFAAKSTRLCSLL